MADQIMSSGQALSTWPFSGSHEETDTLLFANIIDSNATLPIRIQGFFWSHLTTSIRIKDFNGITLYDGASPGTIWPYSASGSYGLIVNAPLTMSIGKGAAGGGGTFIVYGEVL